MEFEGTLGQKIILEEDYVTLKQTSFLGKLASADTIKIEYKNISSIEFQKTTFIQKGYIHFLVAGSGYVRDQEDDAKFVSKLNPYKIHFSSKKNSDAELLIEKINQKIKLVKNNNSAPSNSISNNPDILDQISKLASLKDAGVLTEEEFNKKKADLLSRL